MLNKSDLSAFSIHTLETYNYVVTMCCCQVSHIPIHIAKKYPHVARIRRAHPPPCTHSTPATTTTALYTVSYRHGGGYSVGGCEPPISPKNATDDTQGCCTSCIGTKQPVGYTLSLNVCVQFRSDKSKINSINRNIEPA